MSFSAAVAGALADGLNPTPTQPPGTAGILTIINYVLWLIIAGVSVSLIVGIGQVSMSMRHGGEIEGVKRVLLSGISLALLGSITAVLTAFK